jgi:hypothetical protein
LQLVQVGGALLQPFLGVLLALQLPRVLRPDVGQPELLILGDAITLNQLCSFHGFLDRLHRGNAG